MRRLLSEIQTLSVRKVLTMYIHKPQIHIDIVRYEKNWPAMHENVTRGRLAKKGSGCR